MGSNMAAVSFPTNISLALPLPLFPNISSVSPTFTTIPIPITTSNLVPRALDKVCTTAAEPTPTTTLPPCFGVPTSTRLEVRWFTETVTATFYLPTADWNNPDVSSFEEEDPCAGEGAAGVDGVASVNMAKHGRAVSKVNDANIPNTFATVTRTSASATATTTTTESNDQVHVHDKRVPAPAPAPAPTPAVAAPAFPTVTSCDMHPEVVEYFAFATDTVTVTKTIGGMPTIYQSGVVTVETGLVVSMETTEVPAVPTVTVEGEW